MIQQRNLRILCLYPSVYLKTKRLTRIEKIDDPPQPTAPDVGKLLFHTQSFAILRPGEEVPSRFVDESGIIKKNLDRARNIPSMNAVEREYAARWVSAWHGNPDESDAFLPEFLLRFTSENDKQMFESNEQRLQFSRDLIILQAASQVVDDDCIQRVNTTMRAASLRQQESLPTGGDSSISSEISVTVPSETQCNVCQKPLNAYNSLRCSENVSGINPDMEVETQVLPRLTVTRNVGSESTNSACLKRYAAARRTSSANAALAASLKMGDGQHKCVVFQAPWS